MLGRIFGIMAILSTLFALLTGNGEALGTAILDSVASAVTLTLSLAGMMAFWSGILAVLREAGCIQRLAVCMRPLIRLFFPDAARTGEGVDEICANISANLLGLGNAATPMGLSAMKKLQAASGQADPSVASGDMITLAVLNTASFSLVPGTVISLLTTAGAQNPFRVVGCVWVASGASALLALGLTRLCRTIHPRTAPLRQACTSASADGHTTPLAERSSASPPPSRVPPSSPHGMTFSTKNRASHAPSPSAQSAASVTSDSREAHI